MVEEDGLCQTKEIKSLYESFFTYKKFTGNNIDEIIEFCKSDRDIKFLLGDGSCVHSFTIEGGPMGTFLPNDYFLLNMFCDTTVITEYDFYNNYIKVEDFEFDKLICEEYKNE